MNAEETVEENINVEAAGSEHKGKKDTKDGGVSNAVEEKGADEECSKDQLDLNNHIKRMEDKEKKVIKNKSD